MAAVCRCDRLLDADELRERVSKRDGRGHTQRDGLH